MAAYSVPVDREELMEEAKRFVRDEYDPESYGRGIPESQIASHAGTDPETVFMAFFGDPDIIVAGGDGENRYRPRSMAYFGYD